MSGVELGLAIVATIDLCFKYGIELKRLIRAYRNASNELEEQILRVENLWYRSETQLTLINKAEHLISDYHKQLLDRTLRVLNSKLDIVVSKIRGLVKPVQDTDGISKNVQYEPRKLHYAFKKDSFKEAVDDFEHWQQQLDPSWFLILKISDQRLDTELAQAGSGPEARLSSAWAIRAGQGTPPQGDGKSPGIFLPAEEVGKMTLIDIRLSVAKLAIRQGNSGRLVLSQIPCPPWGNPQLMKRDIRELAQRLRHNEPRTFGLLVCKGVIPQVISSSNHKQQILYTMIFRVPAEVTKVQSLRSLLLSEPPESLSHRFSVARELAKSVCYVHTFGFVHKNIRPETVLSCWTSDSDSLSTFLIGFDDFRKEEGITLRRGDDNWEKNLYRHPSRRGIAPSDDYIMQHDIYSLGICLLEVGLWQSFVVYNEADSNPELSQLLVKDSDHSNGNPKYNLDTAKQDFISLAKTKLPRVMGSRYANIVATCLTCLDPNNADFGDTTQFEDQDGIRVGVRYIEKVLLYINSLCI